jgi:hypothetical protein
MKDPYASEEETKALLVPDTRTHSMKHLDALLESRGAWEQGADPYTVLYGIALEILDGIKNPINLFYRTEDEMYDYLKSKLDSLKHPEASHEREKNERL